MAVVIDDSLQECNQLMGRLQAGIPEVRSGSRKHNNPQLSSSWCCGERPDPWGKRREGDGLPESGGFITLKLPPSVAWESSRTASLKAFLDGRETASIENHLALKIYSGAIWSFTSHANAIQRHKGCHVSLTGWPVGTLSIWLSHQFDINFIHSALIQLRMGSVLIWKLIQR